MPWIVGIDEAGYGPNLGPLVMSSVACRVPDRLAGANLWQVLRSAVRRPGDLADGRVVVGDSKLVYSTTRGLPDLEMAVHSVLPRNGMEPPDLTLSQLIDRLSPDHHVELRSQPWYTGTSPLPAAVTSADYAKTSERFHRACTRRAVNWGLMRSVIVCPARFNNLVDAWGSKAAVLGLGLAELMENNRCPRDDSEPVTFLIDKHGGRNCYAAMLQHELSAGTVVAHEEGAERSRYSVLGLDRPIEIVFEPRADGTHFCVALASMISKYLRELLMLEFNAFWRRHLPELQPTAGYPGDAGRFFGQIQPVLQRLGIAEAVIWRQK